MGASGFVAAVGFARGAAGLATGASGFGAAGFAGVCARRDGAKIVARVIAQREKRGHVWRACMTPCSRYTHFMVGRLINGPSGRRGGGA